MYVVRDLEVERGREREREREREWERERDLKKNPSECINIIIFACKQINKWVKIQY